MGEDGEPGVGVTEWGRGEEGGEEGEEDSIH